MKTANLRRPAMPAIAAVLAMAAIIGVAPIFAHTAELDDATIFAIFDQANTADITTGRLAAKFGHSEAVRAHGRAISIDHEGVQQAARDLARKLDIVPTPPAADASVETLAKAYAALQAKSGVEFDKAYILYEINYHQSAIEAVTNTLLPAIKNAQLKDLVAGVAPAFGQHLAMTKDVAKELGIAQ